MPNNRASQWKLAIAGMYLFGVAYSPGEGPVPFVYSAESMPLYIRDLGMGCVTSINWLFNWLIAITAPKFFNVFYAYGAFLWYAAWCVLLWFLIFLFVNTLFSAPPKWELTILSVSYQKPDFFPSRSWKTFSASEQGAFGALRFMKHAGFSDA